MKEKRRGGGKEKESKRGQNILKLLSNYKDRRYEIRNRRLKYIVRKM